MRYGSHRCCLVSRQEAPCNAGWADNTVFNKRTTSIAAECKNSFGWQFPPKQCLHRADVICRVEKCSGGHTERSQETCWEKPHAIGNAKGPVFITVSNLMIMYDHMGVSWLSLIILDPEIKRQEPPGILATPVATLHPTALARPVSAPLPSKTEPEPHKVRSVTYTEIKEEHQTGRNGNCICGFELWEIVYKAELWGIFHKAFSALARGICHRNNTRTMLSHRLQAFIS